MTKRSVLTAAAVTGIAASFLALTFLRFGPAESDVAQLTGSSKEVTVAAPVKQAASEALAGKADAKAVAPSQDSPAAIAKPEVIEKALPVRENKAVLPSTKQPARAQAATKPVSPAAEADSCAALSKSVDVFLQHFYAAHLERSPGGQVEDLLDLDQYVLTHTVMIEDMLKPQLSVDAGKSVDVFLAHLYAAHLERSLGGQVEDAVDLDQYVLTHTVMIEDMLKPIAAGELASC